MTDTGRRSTPQRFQRETNVALVLKLLRDRGTASRSELARLIGIDRSTLTSIAADLLEVELVREEEGELAGTRGGRRPRLLSLNEKRVVALGVEVNDGFVHGALCSLRGEVLREARATREPATDAREWTATAVRAVRGWLEQWRNDLAKEGALVVGVGVGVPGLVDPSRQTVRESVALGVHDLDLGRLWSDDADAGNGDIAAVPLFVDNDANCCAWNLAEQEPDSGTTIFVQLNMHRDGTGGFRPSLAGVGLSLLLDGRVYYGSSHAAGELRGYRWRHTDADQLGVKPECGRADEAVFAAVSEELLRNLGVIASALDPTHIVLGGDLAGRDALIDKQVTSTLADTAVAPFRRTGVLTVADEGEYLVRVGAAQMVLHELFSLPVAHDPSYPELGWQRIMERLRARVYKSGAPT